MADLFIRSGWTQEELAAKEGKGQTWVVYRLRFGRFLNFITTVINAENLPNGLTEGRFRGFWDPTDKSLPAGQQPARASAPRGQMRYYFPR